MPPLPLRPPGFMPPRGRRHRHARPSVVALEDRTLMADGNAAFAHLGNASTALPPRNTIPMAISPDDFSLAAGHLLLGFAATESRAGRPIVIPNGHTPARTLAHSNTAGFTLAELRPGSFALYVGASGHSDVAVSLAGDANADFRVDASDLATIRSLKGRHRGDPGYLRAADVNRDGSIGSRDLRLARRNLGAATRIRPLDVTLALDPATPTTAGGAAYGPAVIVDGRTTPGATVVLDGAGGPPASETLSNDPRLVIASSPKLTTTADPTGRYHFAFDAAVGDTALRVEATDAFGQRATDALTVTRVVDARPPAIAILGPASGLATRGNVAVSGRVTDDLSGVAALGEQVDSGPSLPIPRDPSGNFAFTTTLPTDGSADGPHTVHLHAADAAGNATDAAATFTLDTTAPAITIEGPAPGATVHDSPTVTGRVADRLSGVATLLAQVDSGSTVAVAVDASGGFRFATALAADGSADGFHTVHFHAVDGLGNASDASVTFVLATDRVNRAVTTDPGVQQQPSIAVDPLDANHLVLAYMDRSLVTTGYAGIGVATSRDAGATWQHTSVPLPAGFEQGAANPIVKFDGQGHVFVSFMAATFLGPLAPITNANFDQRGVPGIQSNNGIFVSRSDDGGLSWDQPVAVFSHIYNEHTVVFEATPDLAIDTFRTLPDGSPNPHNGELYVTWTRIYAPGLFPGVPDSTGGTDIMISVSKDGGQTWQLQLQTLPDSGLMVTTLLEPGPPLTAKGSGLGFGYVDQTHVTVGPEGDIYVSNVGGGDFVVQHSTDDGQTFSVPNHDTGLGIAFGTGGATFVDAIAFPTNHFRTYLLRAIAADPTRPGTLYATEAVQALDVVGNVIDSADVRFARSTDHGRTWQTSFMVGPYTGIDLNDDNHGQSATGSPDDVITGQVFPRVAVDAQGNIAVIWYDTRHDPAKHLLDVFGSVSTDGGQTFSPNFRITSQSFDANAGRFTDAVGQTDYYLGDFLGLSIANGTAYATWTDIRSGNQDIEFTHFPLNPAPAPPNDRFEPNDTAQVATNLGTVTSDHLPKLALPPGDNDWFRVTAASTGNLTVTATPSDSRLGLQVELWAASGATLLASGSAVTGEGGQQLVFAGQSGTSYLIHVEQASGSPAPASISSQYALGITSLTADLGKVVYRLQNGSLQPGDQAYYRLVAGASGSLVVMLTPGASFNGDVNLQLLDPAKLTVLATGSMGSGGVVTASLAVQEGQALLVGVSSGASIAGDYVLKFLNLDQFATSNSRSLVFPAGAGPSSVAVADLTGNGELDLVVADALSDTLSVLPGNGDGTFQAPRQFAIGAFKSPNPTGLGYGVPNFGRQVVIADFNRDDIPDVAVTNFDSGDISVLLGRGDGTFQPQSRFDATTAPFGLALGDFNGDGIPDLAAIDSHGNVDSAVAVLLGRGDGTFQPEKMFAALTGPGNPTSKLTVADLNHDGADDLIVSGSNGQLFSVFSSNGDGTFRHAGDYQGGELASGTALLDLNGDGIPDLVTTGRFGTIHVNLGTGNGTFGPPTIYAAGPPNHQLFDMAVADLGSEVTLPDGSTALGPADGHQDLMVAISGIYTGGSANSGVNGVYIVPGLVDDQGHYAGFGSPHLLAPGLAPQSLALGDFTGNHATDIAFVDRDGVHIIYQKPPVIPPNDTPQAARNLGTVVHLVEPTQTIVPGHLDAYYSLTVPTEAARGAGDEVIDFSGLFRATEGAGLAMEVRDSAGNLLGSGERFRVAAPQGDVLTLHVFAATAADNSRGAGAYTLDIDVLPQVVSVEAQTLLPGQGGLPGGPTASLVVTFQGNRLDTATAEDPANYTVTWLGPDGLPGTPDDQVIPLASAGQAVVYNPSANRDVASGTVHPTAIRQTVTLLFDRPLPAGSYRVDLAPAIQAASFNDDEPSLLTGGAGHPVVTLDHGLITDGAHAAATDLVLQSGALGNLATLKAGNTFLTQLHDDLGALLDSKLKALGDSPTITSALIDQIVRRFGQALGTPGHRVARAVVLVFDPVSIGVEDPDGNTIDYDLDTGDLADNTMDSYVNVDGNLEIVVLVNPPMDMGDISVEVADVADTARGAVISFDDNGETVFSLTDDLRDGMTDYMFPPD